MITNITGTITLDSLPKNLFKKQLLSEINNLEEIVSSKIDTIVKDSIEFEKKSLLADVINQVEKPLLRSVLSQTKWNQQKASKILGINRNTLRKKIETLNLKN